MAAFSPSVDILTAEVGEFSCIILPKVSRFMFLHEEITLSEVLHSSE